VVITQILAHPFERLLEITYVSMIDDASLIFFFLKRLPAFVDAKGATLPPSEGYLLDASGSGWSMPRLQVSQVVKSECPLAIKHLQDSLVTSVEDAPNLKQPWIETKTGFQSALIASCFLPHRAVPQPRETPGVAHETMTRRFFPGSCWPHVEPLAQKATR